jgi:threonine/homoserine/homoserine lactone efflux protein
MDSTIESATMIKAFTLGMQIPLINTKMWVFTLGAISTISYAQVALPISISTYLIFTVLVQTLLILPILLLHISAKTIDSVFTSNFNMVS